jgi:DNA-binding beta-propeller fold protein YncE
MNWRDFRRGIASVLLAAAACGAAACRQHETSAVPGQLLYASVPDQRSVMIFDASVSGAAAPLTVIKEAAPDVPISVGMDLEGEIYLANRNGNLAVYAGRGSAYQLVRRLAGPHTQLGRIAAMAVDGSGGLYIANQNDDMGGPRIVVFAGRMSGNVMPDHSISGPHTGLTSPVGIAIDATGRSFIADHDSGKILVFDAGARGDTPPLGVIDVTHPDSVLIDQELNLYADSGATHSITAFIPMGPQNWAHNSTITAAELQAPHGMAVDKDGGLAVAVPGGVAFFGASAGGASIPRRVLLGPAPFNPEGIAIK